MSADGRKTRIQRQAQRLSLEQYRPELHRYLLRCMRQNHSIEDLLQDVYVRFLQSPHQELVRQPRPYLYRIAANVMAEFNLKQKRQPLIYDSEATIEQLEEDSGADAWRDSLSERLNQRQLLKKMLTRLPKVHRAVLLMRIQEGLSHEEIAAKLGISPPTARAYLSRALAQCRMQQADR